MALGAPSLEQVGTLLGVSYRETVSKARFARVALRCGVGALKVAAVFVVVRVGRMECDLIRLYKSPKRNWLSGASRGELGKCRRASHQMRCFATPGEQNETTLSRCPAPKTQNKRRQQVNRCALVQLDHV